jgi:glycosyltransferase involved in cell wall biosynthesis
LVRAGDANALAEAVDVVLSDADVAADLVNRGQHRAHRTFSWSVCARLMVEQYQRCIDLC